MQIIHCTKCGKRYKVKANNGKANTKYQCGVCRHVFVVANRENTKDSYPLVKTRPPFQQNQPRGKETWQSGFSAASVEVSPEASSERALSLRTKFNLPICLVFLCTIVLTYFFAGSRLQKDAENQVFDKARLLLTTMEASRSFTSKVIKPVLYEALPNRFITEGMSSSFGARNIFERIHKTYPQYYFKHAAPFPRNPINQADAFEMDVIEKFKNDPDLKAWKGFRIKGEEEKYSIMKPIVAEQRCMRCHSDPAIAPQELLDRYGSENGFGRTVGEVIGTLTVSVPSSVIIEKARNNTIVFIGMVVLFFLLLTLIVNVFFSRMVLKPIQQLSEHANEISLGKLDTQINASGGDEIAALAKAFNRMKKSIRIAFNKMTLEKY
jgi:HAMP domain-containing protein